MQNGIGKLGKVKNKNTWYIPYKFAGRAGKVRFSFVDKGIYRGMYMCSANGKGWMTYSFNEAVESCTAEAIRLSLYGC